MPLTTDSRPRLWKVARVDYDRVRQRPVILYPEGALFINDTAKAILELCDGQRTVGDIAAELGTRYQADVLPDVLEFLTDMHRREILTLPAES
jgi:pyrroloquinoline quinone biosynthesis protein D